MFHTQDGAALLRRLSLSKQQIEEQQMPNNDSLQQIVKDSGGITGFAKMIVAKPSIGGHLSEHEFVGLIESHAKQDSSTFVKVFTADTEEALLLRKAHSIVKGHGLNTEPQAVANTAYVELLKLAATERKRSPELSMAQAFDKIYGASENAPLVLRERAESRPRA
jgi:hypothetical protein